MSSEEEDTIGEEVHTIRLPKSEMKNRKIGDSNVNLFF